MKNKTQTIFIIVLLVLLTIVIGAGTISSIVLYSKVNTLSNEVKNLKNARTFQDTGSGTTTEEEQLGYDTSNFKEIKGTDIASESKGKTIVVMIGRQSCGYCTMYAPILDKVSQDYHFQVRYIDLEKLIDIYSPNWDVIDQKSYDTLMNLNATDEYKTFMNELGATPMTIIIKDNTIIGGIMGYVPEETLINDLEGLGFKK